MGHIFLNIEKRLVLYAVHACICSKIRISQFLSQQSKKNKHNYIKFLMRNARTRTEKRSNSARFSYKNVGFYLTYIIYLALYVNI